MAAALKQHCPNGSTSTSTTWAAPSSTRCWAGWPRGARRPVRRDLQLPHRRSPGPANYVNLLSKTALMQGFNALDQWGRFDEAFAALRQWEADGRWPPADRL